MNEDISVTIIWISAHLGIPGKLQQTNLQNKQKDVEEENNCLINSNILKPPLDGVAAESALWLRRRRVGLLHHIATFHLISLARVLLKASSFVKSGKTGVSFLACVITNSCLPNWGKHDHIYFYTWSIHNLAMSSKFR
ncbi:hypothetical protein WA026_003890 [Henosepilachna vigintioctopunctata]|uniref:Uncharacterized protein n=1 Tax=Henosepilachna vigintioctopunctata TaxID=420089 RepID=A0AAW1UH77_9CUCU